MPRTDIVFYGLQQGFTETQVGNALAKLRREQRIFVDFVPRPKHGEEAEPAQLFWLAFDSDKIAECKDLMKQRLAIVDDTDVLEKAGEGYVRSLYFNIRASERKQGVTRFGRRITAPEKLGKIGILHKQEADLKIRYSMAGADFTLFHEVKNQNYSVTKHQIDKLIRQSIENSTVNEVLMPVMIASYIDQKGKDLLTSNGVLFHELGRQIFPTSFKARIIELYGVEMANDRFQFIAKRPLRARPDRPTAKVDRRTNKDIAVISNPGWIEAGALQWFSLLKSVAIA
jgi:hypothetical protein